MTECTKKNLLNDMERFGRQRINALLAEAIKKPLVIVCAGTGYGKTSAVRDFMQDVECPAAWMQFSGSDNAAPCFWGNYIRMIAQIDDAAARGLQELGFPDTEERLEQYNAIRKRIARGKKHLLVFDDAHLVTNPDVKQFLELMINDDERKTTTVMICRELPPIRIMSLHAKRMISYISEESLKLTGHEIGAFFRREGLSVEPESLHDILLDTNGWALAVCMVARSLLNSPGYPGYVRNALKRNIFELLETDLWSVVSERLKRFLVRLSLIDHLSAELISILTENDISLLSEFERQNAYIRYDKNTNAYLIHHMLAAFLHTKQGYLDEDEMRETYKTAAEWCAQNGFICDSLNYYEKIRDYGAIMSVFPKIHSHMPGDQARCLIGIIQRAPDETFDRVELFAALHLSVLFNLGRFSELRAKARDYAERFLKLPEGNGVRNRALAYSYYYSGAAQMIVGAADDCYSFDEDFAKMFSYMSESSLKSLNSAIFTQGPWANPVTSAKQGAPLRYIEALARTAEIVSGKADMSGYDDLCKGELLFYQGDINAAEFLLVQALGSAAANRQLEIMHRALMYIMRIATLQGKQKKAGQALKDLEAGLDEKEYAFRYVTYDIAVGWYYYILRSPGMVPEWLKGSFTPYTHELSIENFGNQVKARYHYLTRNYPPLLSYVNEAKRREQTLFGKVELLAIEACVRYQMGDKTKALELLREAYETASPNCIIMPFIELGKDMRTLTSAAMRAPGLAIPEQWLKTINQKSIIYSKYQALIVAEYNADNYPDGGFALSNRETKVLRDMYNGLSRTEIAANQDLSINTIKMVINSIFDKLCANNTVDAVRISAERKLV